MLEIEDYKAYLLQNYNFIDDLRSANSLLYERLDDVFSVLEYIEERFTKYQKVEEELEVIFEVGFSFLHEQIEELKNLIRLYFQNDPIGLRKYEHLLNYHLYLSDLTDALKEKEQYNNDVKNALLSIEEDIDNILREKKDFDDSTLMRFNTLVEENVKVGTFSTLEIFSQIREELDI